MLSYHLDKEVAKVTFDPNNELADAEANNNAFPKVEKSTKLDEFKKKGKRQGFSFFVVIVY